MKAIAYTWVRDYRQMAEDMRTSFHHFHPDVPLCIFDWEQCQMIMEKYSCTSSFLYAPLGKELATGDNLVIHIDADIIVTGPLDRLFSEAYDVAGVRAFPDIGRADSATYRRQNRLSVFRRFPQCSRGACRPARVYDLRSSPLQAREICPGLLCERARVELRNHSERPGAVQA